MSVATSAREHAKVSPSAPTVPGLDRRAVRAVARLAVLAVPLGALVALRDRFPLELPLKPYLGVHTVAELIVVAVLLASFAVQWSSTRAHAGGDARARFLAPALLAGAALSLLHLLTFPGMPEVLGPSGTERSITYWLAARLWITGALLVVPAIRPDSTWRARWSRAAYVANAAVVAGAIALDLAGPERALFYVEGEGLTPLKKGCEALLAAAAAAGAIVHGRAARRTRDRARAGVAAALAVTALSEICFALYATAHDAFNLLGHAYLVIAAGYMLDALLLAAIVRPYRELAALRAHVEDELNVTIDRLRERTEQRDDLLRGVSHDLRSPLQVVLLQAHQLAASGDDDGRRRGRAVLASAWRIDRMLRDLTDAARIEGGALALDRRPVALRPFVADLLAVNEGVLDVARVSNDVPADLPQLDADPDRLDRILVNLFSNALKYTAGPVTIGAEAQGDVVRVRVSDTGPGIPADRLPRLFERYTRAGDPEGPAGLGLGLFLVRRLVEAHGGELGVESREDDGSTFAFTIPVHGGGAAAGASTGG